MAAKRHHSSHKKSHNSTFEEGLTASRPGYGVNYTSPFPKNGFHEGCIMKDYPSVPNEALDNPYNGLEAIDKINDASARGIRRSAASKKGPY